ncbi:MAG: TonB-dependent receptor [Sphingobacteriales bacterium]|nr:TonB-dependent receptor [Sphingobacteriales bacterium]
MQIFFCDLPLPSGKIMAKTLLIMKLIVILLFATCLQASANVYAQQISLSVKNSTLKRVFSEIKKQTGYSFLWDEGILRKAKTVSFTVKDASIEDVMSECLRNQSLTYTIDKRLIVVKAATAAVPDAVPVPPPPTDINLSGRVTNARKEPLEGVSVTVKGTQTGTTTDADGRFRLSVPSANVELVFSFVGYAAQTIKAGIRTVFNIVLEEAIADLTDVVVVGYGTQKKVNLTGAISSIKAEELTKRPSYSVTSLIQGRASGVQIIQQSGEPGNEKLKIAIRGQGTFSSAGSNPLVVVDGIAYPSWDGLDNLDPGNIETIDILKDAASASIYGARAANGVILVTTKKGIIDKRSISYNGSIGFQTPTFIPKFISNSAEYMEMWNYTVDRQGTGQKFPEALISAYKNATPGDPQYPNFDWRDAIFNPGWGQRHSIGIRGGNDKTKYFTDVSYYDQDAIVRGQSYKRYNAQFNLDTKITDWITFGTNINMLFGKKHGPATNSIALIQTIYDMNPTTSPHLPDGRWSVGSVSAPYFMTGNPMRLTDTDGDGGTAIDEKYSITANGFVNIKLLPELLWNVTGSYAYNESFGKIHQRIPADGNEYYFQSRNFAKVMAVTKLGVEDSWSRFIMPSVYSTLNYTKVLPGSHNMSALVGYSQEQYKIRSLYGQRRDYSFPNLSELNAGDPSVQTLNGTSSEWSIQSFFGRLGYNYNGKYLFEANARYDGTSRIQKNNRWGLFPSFSLGWRISEENFLKSSDWLDNLKVRASWGQLGNQNIGTYPYQSLLTTTNYAQGTGVQQGVLRSALSDPNLKWEITTIQNLGIDLDIKQGLFSLVFDIYDKNTSGILNTAEIPASVGLSAPTINYGSLNNKGFEFTIGHRGKIRKLGYSVDVNFSHNRNKITKLITPSYGLNSNQVGYEYGAYYMLEWIGIYQSGEEISSGPTPQYNSQPGDLKFKDQSKDGKITADDRVILPGRYPKFIYGGNIRLNWRSLDLSVFIQGVSGTRHYITRRGEWPFLRMAPPTEEWRQAWTPENHTNKMPALYAWPYNPVSGTDNSYFLKNTSYVRLKNMQLGYTLPPKITGKIGIENLRMYISADNWLTYAPYTINDPERDEDVQYSGQTEAGSYPNVKTFTFGVILNLK